MRKTIYKLRTQPEHVRKQILYITTFAGGLIMVLLWIVSLGHTFKDTDTKASIKNDLEPLKVLKDNISDGYNSISN